MCASQLGERGAWLRPVRKHVSHTQLRGHVDRLSNPIAHNRIEQGVHRIPLWFHCSLQGGSVTTHWPIIAHLSGRSSRICSAYVVWIIISWRSERLLCV